MKYLLQCLGANAVAIVCAAFAGWLAVTGRDGWGWFLFAAILASVTLSERSSK